MPDPLKHFTGNVYLFAGEARDSVVGLDYLRARYLDVETGRFVSRDSFEGFIQQPGSLHRYLYVNANPVNLIDPSGEFSLASLSAAVGINNILSSLALTHFLFAGLTLTVIIRVIGPGIQGRHTALLAIASATVLKTKASATDDKNLTIEAAYNLYHRSNEIIAIGTQLIQITEKTLAFANAFVGLGSAVKSYAKSTGSWTKAANSTLLVLSAIDVKKTLGAFKEEPDPGLVETSIKKFAILLLKILATTD